eukprot:TRINITY_DN5192_c0_g2_i1.p1 TRINITY_DN5192_c0_g2~~TRINITY_DN5192_c0_g2_i1.p1  ORF type:complete len:351 (+),score=54.90 TRINITY_DN5192_c0_g2_i1:170-1222(+)
MLVHVNASFIYVIDGQLRPLFDRHIAWQANSTTPQNEEATRTELDRLANNDELQADLLASLLGEINLNSLSLRADKLLVVHNGRVKLSLDADQIRAILTQPGHQRQSDSMRELHAAVAPHSTAMEYSHSTPPSSPRLNRSMTSQTARLVNECASSTAEEQADLPTVNCHENRIASASSSPTASTQVSQRVASAIATSNSVTPATKSRLRCRCQVVLAPLLNIKQLSPAAGPHTGGTLVEVALIGLPERCEASMLVATFGDVTVPVLSLSDHTATCIAPPHRPGPVTFELRIARLGWTAVSTYTYFDPHIMGRETVRICLPHAHNASVEQSEVDAVAKLHGSVSHQPPPQF